MALKTKANIPFISPLAHALRGQTPVAANVAQDSVGLADHSGQTLIHLRSANLASVITDIPQNAGDVTASGDSILARLRGDGVLVIGDGANHLQDTVDGSLLTITDITHGRGYFVLMGKHANDVLVKTCGLDFADRAFPNNHAAQSSLAKVRTTIIRHDSDSIPAYHLIMGYSLAEYVWGVVFDAMQEFGGVYVK